LVLQVALREIDLLRGGHGERARQNAVFNYRRSGTLYGQRGGFSACGERHGGLV